jgi:hypothetical protein
MWRGERKGKILHPSRYGEKREEGLPEASLKGKVEEMKSLRPGKWH